jgi:hypothetical protein
MLCRRESYALSRRCLLLVLPAICVACAFPGRIASRKETRCKLNRCERFEIRSKVNDEPEHVYKAGESWTERPGDHHQVSANASSTKPARLLAIFVLETTEKEIVIPDK